MCRTDVSAVATALKMAVPIARKETKHRHGYEIVRGHLKLTVRHGYTLFRPSSVSAFRSVCGTVCVCVCLCVCVSVCVCVCVYYVYVCA